MQKGFWHNLVLIVIVLAITQTFLDEYSRYQQWSVSARNILIIAGTFFDFLFSIEFTVKIILAARKKEAGNYLKYNGGWIDLLNSFPLLLLNLPSFLLLFTGDTPAGPSAEAFYNALKFIRDIRIIRVLRFLRIIKIFGKTAKAESPMADRHITVISSITALAIICSFILFSFLFIPVNRKILERGQWFDDSISTIKFLEGKSGISYKDIAKKMFSENRHLLSLIYKDEIIISAIGEERFSKYYDYGDYRSIKNRGFELDFSVVDINRETAYGNMMVFFIIIFTALSIRFFYKPHFISTISNIINLMNKGFRSRVFNEQVKIRMEFEQDEVSKLAKFYNDAYLPAKTKRIVKENEK